MRHKHKRTSSKMVQVPTTKKGTIRRKIIARLVEGGREYTLHATKGYRSARA